MAWTETEQKAIDAIWAALKPFGKVRVVEILAAVIREAKRRKQEEAG